MSKIYFGWITTDNVEKSRISYFEIAYRVSFIMQIKIDALIGMYATNDIRVVSFKLSSYCQSWLLAKNDVFALSLEF
jgi:hypothetical protein